MNEVYSKKEYVTVEDGVDFRTIAKEVTLNGFPMNHATARNIVFEGIKTIASDLYEKNTSSVPTEEKLNEIVNSRYFQESLPDFLFKICEESLAKKKTEPKL